MENFDTKSVRSCILDVISRGGAVHFVGILGAGMLPLARLLAARGICVSGTDIRTSDNEPKLKESGITFTPYHTDRVLDSARLVVYSLAVPYDSPELVYARARGMPTVTRAELLGAIASTYQASIAVAGTHGKSTTVAILSHILLGGGLSPTVISGAHLLSGDSLVIGDEGLLVVEACEYKNAFLSIDPTVALVTNIDYDHPDFFLDIGEVLSSFQKFALGAGRVFLNASCDNSCRLLTTLSGAVSYGTPESDYALTEFSLGEYASDFVMSIDGEACGFHLPIAGLGALYDAVGAIAVAHSLGVPVSKIRDTVATFYGIDRRIEPLGSISDRPIYYDYAHHPREIGNTLDVLTRRHGSVAVIFRPHTFSRTRALAADFADVFSGVECLTLLDVFAAREAPGDGIDSTALKTLVGDNAYVCDPDNALDFTLSHSHGAIVLMGAGEVDSILSEIKSKLD